MLWSDEEVAILREHWSLGPKAVAQMLPGRTAKAIHEKGVSIGMKTARKAQEWTNKEVERLERIYATATSEELAEAFPRRSRWSVRQKANSLGLRTRKSWTNKEVAEVKEMARSGMSFRQIGAVFGVTNHAIEGVMERYRHGL